LRKLTSDNVQRLYAEKIKKGWTPGSIRNIHKILHKALRNAVRRQMISRNVCDLVTLPRQVKRKVQILTKEQIIYLLKAVRGHRLEPLIIFGLGIGMRHGEIGALCWQNINFEEHTLRVERTVSYISPQGYIVGEPKTENSRRIIILPRFVMQFLIRHRHCQQRLREAVGSRWQDMDLVFCAPTGGFRHPTANGHCLHHLLQRLGLPDMCVHELRHNAATLLASRMNMPANVVQELLGHEDIETTLGLYAHTDLEMQRKMMDGLDDFLGDLD
jgi:integrase